MYSKELPERILSVLKVSNRKLQLNDLKDALQQFRDLPNETWNAAIQDLHSDGMINAAFVRSGLYGDVGAAYNVEITSRGRALAIDKKETAPGLISQRASTASPIGGFTVEDRKFAQLAIAEARKSVSEDDDRSHPKVGAVIVKDGQVLASAHRGEFLGCHAEYVLLERKLSNQSVVGAIVYTTLEPCTARNHPKIPCAYRLVERKVKRVVIGMLDPNPIITGRGQLILRDANVVTDLFPHDLMCEVEELNRDFSRQHRPAFTGGHPTPSFASITPNTSPQPENPAKVSSPCDHGVIYTVYREGGVPTDEQECALCHARFKS